MRLLTLTLALSLAGCASQKIQYPAEQTTASAPTAKASLMRIAKSAYEFEDKDIQVPANFDTQGLQFCDDEFDIEKNACPLDKKAIRIYFGDNKIDSKYAPEAAALTRLNNKTLGLMLENQLAGVNRFRIVTNDNDTIALEKQKQFEEQDVKTVAELNKSAKVLRPDYAVKIDTIKSADRFYGEHNGLAQYHVEMSTSVINPYTKEKLAYPNLGKIRVKGTDVRSKESLVYTEVNNKYYTGFNYSDQDNVHAVFNSMASKAFDVLLSRLLIEMPSSAQVVAFKNNQVTLDRGRNAGILNNETMILFQYQQGFVEPIAVAMVKPSSNSAIAQIVKWKDSDNAEKIKDKADGKIYQTSLGQKVFAVSVGLPQDYVDNRL
ncbi:hypothetical protein N9W11_01515 [Psychrosphaera haliotis]|nr:hypothetical protein [Psychrosphaera haliotis]